MLELHEVEVAGDNVEVGEIGLLDDISQGQGVVIADCAVKRSALGEVYLRLDAIERS